VSGTVVLAAIAGALAVALAVPPSSRLPGSTGQTRPSPTSAEPEGSVDWLRRWRLLWVVLAGVAAWAFLGGAAGALAAPLVGLGTWVVIERAEPAQVRRDREAAVRELPHVVGLLADGLRSGRSPTEALAVVADALPGPASARLAEVVPRLRLGLDPGQVWAELATDPALGPLGRALSRAQRTGAPVVLTVGRLSDDLARGARADVEDRARAVGVKAAVPLGLCLLPAFVLIGIVPVVAGLLTELGL
jgi:Flp pilus assembly protein TadB